MQILKGNGINQCERRSVSNLYMDQSVKIRLKAAERKSLKTGRRVREGCYFCPFFSTCTVNIWSKIYMMVWRLHVRTSTRNSHPEIYR
jgi:hypothetical protein